MENKIYKCIKCGEKVNDKTFKQNHGYCNECNKNTRISLEIKNLNQPAILEINLMDLECKQVLTSEDRRVKKIIKMAEKAYYPNEFLNYYNNEKDDLELGAIHKNIKNDFEKAVRITITSDGKVWCDNTHYLIHYIEKGCLKLKDISFYIVSFGTDENVADVFNYNNSLSSDLEQIRRVVKNAKRLDCFVRNKGRKNISWTIKDLYNQLTEHQGGTSK